MYRGLFFAQGCEALGYLDILEAHGAPALIQYLEDEGALNEDGALCAALRAGGNDTVDQVERLVVVSNPRLSYIGVERFEFTEQGS